MHENLWDRWSRGLSFVKEMTRIDDVHKTKSELCRAQLTMCSPKCCCNKDERTKTHVKNIMLMVFRGLKRECDGIEVCEGPGIWMILSDVAFTDSESTIWFE